MTPGELLDLARQVADRKDPATRGLWPRAATLLARQALEEAVWWLDPRLQQATSRATFLALPHLIEADVAHHAGLVHGRLSAACHHHSYELPPTAVELHGCFATVAELIVAVDTARGAQV